MFGRINLLYLGKYVLIKAASISGYSLILYFLAFCLCIVPSTLWHIIFISLGSLFRWIFLSRNLSTRVEDRPYVVYIVTLIMILAYGFALNQTFYSNTVGMEIGSGMQQVFHARVFED